MNNCCCAELVVDEGQQIELNVESDGGIEVGVAEQFVIGGGGNYQDKTVNITPTESAQSQTVQADVGYDALDEVEVNVAAIADDYVGSAVPRRASSSLTESGATVTVPAGYYANQASKTIPTANIGATLQKGSVSNHSVSVSPRAVISTAGYHATGSINGAVTTISASELVSGTKSITANGTGIDVTNYADVDVAVPSANLGTKAITANGTYNAEDDSLDGYSEVTVNVSGGGGVTKSITNILGDSTTLVTGYLNSGGTSITSASAQKEVTTDYIDIHAYAGDAIIMWQKIGGRVGAWVTAVYYDSNKTRLTTRQGICEPLASNSSFRATSSVEYDATTGVSLASSTAYTIPSNAYYARFSFRTGGNAKICATTDMTSLGYWSHDISEIAFIDAIESDGTAT